MHPEPSFFQNWGFDFVPQYLSGHRLILLKINE